MAAVFEEKIELLSNEYDSEKVKESITFASMMFKRLSNRLEVKDEDLKEIDVAWIVAAAREVLRRDEMLGCIKYSENGYSFEFDDSMLSLGLRSMIFADVRIPS